MSQHLPKQGIRDSLFYVILTVLLASANNRNVIITQRFHAAPVQANREFFWHTDCIFQQEVLSLTRELPECLLSEGEILAGTVMPNGVE